MRKRTIETRISIPKKAGKIFTNRLKAILTALRVFLRFTIKESNNANPVAIYK